MEAKILRNCPYANTDISCKDCIECDYCLSRRQEAMKKRNRLRVARFLIRFLCMILAAIFFIQFITIGRKQETVDQNTQALETEGTIETQAETIDQQTETIEIQTFVEPEVQAMTIIAETESIAIEEFVEIVPTISAYGPGEVYYYELTWEEKILIAKVVYAEARGEIFEGKVAVAAVVLNRYVSNDRRFDRSSIESVVKQSSQFASINWVTIGHLESIPECMEAVEAACKGWDPTRETFEDGAKFFYAPNGISAEEMAKREGVLTMYIGNHAFHNDFN